MANFTRQTARAILDHFASRLGLNRDQLENSSEPPRLLASLVQNGQLDATEIQHYLSRKWTLRRLQLEAEALDQAALKILPPEMLLAHHLIAFEQQGQFLKIAIIDPAALQLAAQIKSLTGCVAEFHLISLSNLESLQASQPLADLLAGVSVPASKTQTRPAFDANQEDQVPAFCEHILRTAIRADASDIHIEPFRDTARLRLRLDGRLQVQSDMAAFLTRHYQAVITRLKILSDLDIAEKRLPQDGRLALEEAGEMVDFRLSILPARCGERAVLRILKSDPALALDRLGLAETDLRHLKEAISAPQGMVLVTGPTGSGKTTTLYGCLKYLNRPDTNIMTAEDPVEYYLDGVSQIQINERIGLGFQAVLRAFLRQDPEIILLGEIRDQETAEIALKAALTGHLLLSTLHTNDAIATLARLVNMGIPAYLLAAALQLVVAQRLARTSCPACAEPDKSATPEQLEQAGFSAGQAASIQPMRGGGCSHCAGSGYKGRFGIYEILPVTPALEAAILTGARQAELLEQARAGGFKTMSDRAREAVAEGRLSLAEFSRVVAL